MVNKQRMKTDNATANRRFDEDTKKSEERARNDELTIERREHSDKVLEDNRTRNDDLTTQRRKLKDGNSGGVVLTLFLLLVVLAFGTYLYFF